MTKQFLHPIVGSFFRPISARKVLAGDKPGDAALLYRDPDNKFDPNAIEVHIGEYHVGFLPKEVAAELAPKLDAINWMRPYEAKVAIHPETDAMQVEFTLPEEASDENV